MAPASELEASDATVAHGAIPPRTFASGRYAVVRVLPEGGQKIVYLVRDTELDRDCALSLIKSDKLQSEDLERLRREAQAMARLGTNAHLVTIFDIGEEDGRPFIVSEFVAGGELRHEIRAAAGPLPLDRALAVTRDVAGALAFAHARGIVHRDIKPANIWLMEDGAAKLGDFGLAFGADRSRLTQDGTFVGTAAYIAPEQALGTGADARSDLYALGCVLYEMVTGRVPFAGDDMVSVISQHIETAPVAPSWHNPQVPHALDTLILQLLAKSPEERPQSAQALLAELDALTSVHVQQLVEPARSNPLERIAGGVFVGRDREVGELRLGLDEALSGRGQLMLVVGEPGIGKTRTANELCTYARLRGTQIATGRCYEGDGAPAYWPWMQVLRSYVAECDAGELRSDMGPGAADIAQMVSEVHAKLPGLVTPPTIEPDQARFRLFDSITTFLKNAARRRPLVLLLDDLHWADKASLLLLQFLARNLAGTRLLVLGTYRDVELGRQHPLAQTLAELAREQVGQRVLLRGLGEPEVARYIEMTSGITPSDALVATVFRETEGNPFFLSEVVRLLVADGRLQDSADTGRWTVSIPQSVREVVGRRLDRLSEECNRILTTAAVIGREFGLDALERLTQRDGDPLLELIEEAEAARVVEEVHGQRGVIGRYAFSHALIRETLYDEVSTTRRVRLHKQIGETLEALYAHDVESHLAELAYHFYEAAVAGEAEKAIEYARRAGDRSVSLVAWEEAAGHYERALQALELLSARDEHLQAELLLALGEALMGAGDRAGNKEAFIRAADVARRVGDSTAFAHAALGIAAPLPVSDPQIIGLLEEALDFLPPGDSALRAMVTAKLAQELDAGGQRERTIALEQEALAIARRVGDKPALAYTIGRLMFTADIYSRPAQFTDLIDECIRVAEEMGNKMTAANAYIFRAMVSLTLGERDAADAAIDANERLNGELRTPGLVSQLRAMQARLDGRLDVVEALVQKGLVDFQRLEPQSALQFFGAQMLDLRRVQGRIAELEGVIKVLAEQVPVLPAYRAALAFVYSEENRLPETRAVFDELAMDDFAAFPDDATGPISLVLLAEVCCYLHDQPRAAALYKMLLPLADKCIGVGPINCTGSASAPLGSLAAMLGRFDEAERHFAEAIEMNLRLRAPTWVAEAQFRYASMLLLRGGAGDRERAIAILDEATTKAKALGMKALLDRAGVLRAVEAAAT
ncbi:MAG: protein kinase [Chloroflexota bacterium]|nr:protein kinase [Chloroflexota bacterium]